MRNGTRPTRISHKDYDLLKSHKYGSALPPKFDDEFFADAGLTMPDQETVDTEFVPPVPAMPYGCTNEAQADATTDLTLQKHNPEDLDKVTNANARGGIDIRESLDAAVSIGWIKGYFNCRPSTFFDYFDVFRTAQVLGLSYNEKRAISWGTPWFPSWEAAAQSGQFIMPMPKQDELNNVDKMPWHNSILDGWTNEAGQLVYRNKSWQGNQIGDRGFLYFPRKVINKVMTIPGTVAYTATLLPVANPQPISLSYLQWIVSWIQHLLQSKV